MKQALSSRRFRCLTWRSFDSRCGRDIEGRLRRGQAAPCPFCGDLLEARPGTRFQRCLVLDATGYDLDCRACRRFWCVVQHTPRSLRLIRMRRLVAAVRAADRVPEAAPFAHAGYAGYSVVA
jgi:hypothetical protein